MGYGNQYAVMFVHMLGNGYFKYHINKPSNARFTIGHGHSLFGYQNLENIYIVMSKYHINSGD